MGEIIFARIGRLSERCNLLQLLEAQFVDVFVEGQEVLSRTEIKTAIINNPPRPLFQTRDQRPTPTALPEWLFEAAGRNRRPSRRYYCAKPPGSLGASYRSRSLSEGMPCDR